MYKESELQTINSWVIAPSTQDSENLASKSHETRRIPDPYAFLIEDGKLKTLNGNLVEDSISKEGPIYEAEFKALNKIQDWTSKDNNEVSLWFSPPYPGGYSCLKIVASEVVNSVNGKILFNRAIIFDVDLETSLKIANYLSDTQFTNSEILRENPIFVDKNSGWMDLLEIYTDQIGVIKSSRDLEIKKSTLMQLNEIYSSFKYRGLSSYEARYYLEIEANRQGLIGEQADSCSAGGSSGAFNTFFENSLPLEGILGSFPCPRCHGAIPSGLGITVCPHCGLTKEEAGSTCG